jgi:hypothetical protein
MRSEAWRPAAAARNRSPREAGTPPSRHYDLGARSSLHGSARQLPAVVGRRAPKETEARPREPKTATVERREASVPRHGTQGASQAPGLPRHVQAPRVFRRAPERFSALRPPLDSGGVKERCKPRAQKRVAGTRRSGLFDIVSCLKLDARPHPEERACERPAPHSSTRARVSKGEGGHGMQPSCFETHRSARPLWKHLRSRRAAMLLSMRARHVLGERSQRSFGRATPRGRTNLRL